MYLYTNVIFVTSYLSVQRLGVVVLIAPGLEVLAGVGTSGLLPGQRALHDLHRVDEQVLQLQRLHQVAVPDEGAVGNFDVLDLLVDIAHLAMAWMKGTIGWVNKCKYGENKWDSMYKYSV